MSVPVPLSVRLTSASKDVFVTREVRDISFTSSAPGGFGTCTITLDRSVALTPPEIALYGLLRVYDTRHGGIVWAGRLEDPGRGVTTEGQVWTVTAVGGAANAHDRQVPVIYVDQSLERAVRNSGSRRSMETDIDGESIKIMARRGDTVSSGSWAEMQMLQFRDAGQEIARVELAWDSGITDPDWRVQVISEPSATTLLNVQTNVAGSGGTIAMNVPTGDTWMRLRMQRQNTGQTVANDVSWITFSNITVIGRRFNADGTVKTGYVATVLGHQVVADVFGRLMKQCDGTNMALATNTYPIDHLSFIDAADGGGILDEVMVFHPDHYWAVWEPDPVTGKYASEWVKWPTTPRLEASAIDGYDGPGSAAELWDSVAVRWKSRTGQVRTEVRTQVVPALAAAGVPRQAFIDLGADSGSLANANQAGDAFLSQHQHPANDGTLTIRRAVLDAVTGRMVQPWELARFAGQLIRVRDIAPRLDALNPSDRDGVTIFRVVGVTYSPDAGAVLDLDSQNRRLDKVIAQARRDIRRARRR